MPGSIVGFSHELFTCQGLFKSQELASKEETGCLAPNGLCARLSPPIHNRETHQIMKSQAGPEIVLQLFTCFSWPCSSFLPFLDVASRLSQCLCLPPHSPSATRMRSVFSC